MEIMKIIGMLIGIVLIAVGILLIFDARKLSAKWFNFHDSNEGTQWFKIGGFALSIIGILMLYFTR